MLEFGITYQSNSWKIKIMRLQGDIFESEIFHSTNVIETHSLLGLLIE